MRHVLLNCPVEKRVRGRQKYAAKQWVLRTNNGKTDTELVKEWNELADLMLEDTE